MKNFRELKERRPELAEMLETMTREELMEHYAFSRSDFSEKRADKLFSKLETAIQYEKELRERIRKIVKARLFPEKIQDDKRLLIMSHLKAIKKAKSKNVMDEMLQILIEDLQDYKKEVELQKS